MKDKKAHIGSVSRGVSAVTVAANGFVASTVAPIPYRDLGAGSNDTAVSDVCEHGYTVAEKEQWLFKN